MFEKPRILIVSHEFQTRRFLRVNLELFGYAVHEMETGYETLRHILHLQPDLLILDRELPDLDGLEVLNRLRQRIKIPVMMLLNHDLFDEKIAVSDAGADDYFIKPFPIEVLMTRMNALLYHLRPHMQESLFTSGDLQVDLKERRVMVKGEVVKLTATEYALLRLIIRHVGKVLTHRQILKFLWGDQATDKIHLLRVHMAQLRQKLEPEPNKPRFLLTEIGVGYRLALSLLIMLLGFCDPVMISMASLIA